MPSGKIRNPISEDWLRLTNKRMWPLEPVDESHPFKVRTRTASIIKAVPGVGIPIDTEMIGKGPGTMSVTSDGKYRPDQRWQYKEAADDKNQSMGGVPEPPVAGNPPPAPPATGVEQDPGTVAAGQSLPAPPAPEPAPAGGASTQPSAPAPEQPPQGVVGIPGVIPENPEDSSGLSGVEPPSTEPENAGLGQVAPFDPSVADSGGVLNLTSEAPPKNPHAELPAIPSRESWYRVMGPQSDREYRALRMLYSEHPNLVANSRVPALMAQIAQSVNEASRIDPESANPYEIEQQNRIIRRAMGFRTQLLDEINRLRDIATHFRDVKLRHPALPDSHAQFVATVRAMRPAFESAQRRAASLLSRGDIDPARATDMINRQIAFSLSRYTGTMPEEVPPDMINTAKQILMNDGELPPGFAESTFEPGYIPRFETRKAPREQSTRPAPQAAAVAPSPVQSRSPEETGFEKAPQEQPIQPVSSPVRHRSPEETGFETPSAPQSATVGQAQEVRTEPSPFESAKSIPTQTTPRRRPPRVNAPAYSMGTPPAPMYSQMGPMLPQMAAVPQDPQAIMALLQTLLQLLQPMLAQAGYGRNQSGNANQPGAQNKQQNK